MKKMFVLSKLGTIMSYLMSFAAVLLLNYETKMRLVDLAVTGDSFFYQLQLARHLGAIF